MQRLILQNTRKKKSIFSTAICFTSVQNFPVLLQQIMNTMPAFLHFHPIPTSPLLSPSRSLLLRPRLTAAATSSPNSLHNHNQHLQLQYHLDEDHAIGDCLVFDDSAFEDVTDPFIFSDSDPEPVNPKRSPKKNGDVQTESLIPDKWKDAAAELTLTKKEKRKIAHQLKYGSKLLRRKKLPLPDMEEYKASKETKLAQLNPVVLDNPKKFLQPPFPTVVAEPEGRVTPKNPRLEVGEGSLDDITDFFNSRNYVPWEMNDDKKPKGARKLFTKEEKVLLNKRIPNLAEATSRKWLPLHTLAASGEFYLVNTLLKHNIDINAEDKTGLTALHKAILGKKQAITNYLLRESANPFVKDKDGATLIHYAVQTASSHTIKILQLYNVDIDLPDNDGWTPLHLAVQTQRTDIVRLLLIKGADRTLKNQDGLTPLDLCLRLGHGMKTYELIKLLKGPPSRSHP